MGTYEKVKFPDIQKQVYYCIYGLKFAITSTEVLLGAISSNWWSATSPDLSQGFF